ncbi:Pkinase-domain-containing protein [Nadsonia fulvescens var. elongata DSM 6958]|uniref:calcium/calmodulin-dependent protein kinase n=1 Tax=Nadsonia fulvescens var. elongata DSM 6958 TaxID=857566 RepID=A0A1E3PGZ2_9ASCO|nr:Pkinase-domain-containing protein [Nadsonia fulvescens var. elongata DSM 6958]
MSFSGLIGKVTGQPASYYKKSEYSFGKTLGAGTFGVVKYATWNHKKIDDNGKLVPISEEVAVKIILKKNLKGNERMVYDELEMLRQLNHPHVIAFKDWFESKDKFYIVTQLAIGGELFDRICKQGKFTERNAVDTFKDILSAVDYLHHKNIVHRDLKPENLLYVTPDPKSPLVLADFGIAKALESPDQLLTSMAGSFGYAAPEVLMGTGHGKPCDIWSLGVITYTLLSGYSPFRAEDISDFLEEVCGNDAVVFHKRYWKDISFDAKEIIIQMLDVDPAKRPTTDQLKKHRWLVGETANNHTDLLPNIREGFNARQTFKRAIEVVRLANRIKALNMENSDDEDDGEGATDASSSSSSKSKADSMRSKWGLKGNATKAFQEVVLAAARNKDMVKDTNEE